MKATPLSYDQITELLYRFDNGESRRSLCLRFCIGEQRLIRVLADHGLIKKPPTKARYMEDEFGNRICVGKPYAKFLEDEEYRKIYEDTQNERLKYL